MVVVIGALALDVVAHRDRFLPGTSNPAVIRWAPGGVGYRIWRRLPAPKLLLTAVGDDPAGRWLEERVRAREGRGSGWPPEGGHAEVLRLPRFPTACYSAFMEAGRLLYGAADMEVIERGLTWARLRPHLPDLGPSDLLVLEANLAPALAAALLTRCGGRTRVVFEGVSVEKLRRHAGSLRDLFLLSTNEEELAAARAGGGREWARVFLAERRIGHWLIGRGRRGARLLAQGADGRVRSRLFPPARVVRAADTTGAGDRLLAGVLARLDRTGSVERAVPGAMREVEKAIEEGKL